MSETDDSLPSDMAPTARGAAVDALVGSRLRLCREILGWSIEDMADAVGQDAAILGDYEAGRVRISPVALTDMAQVLQVPVIWFFVGSGTLEDDRAREVEVSQTAALSADEECVAGQQLTLLAKDLGKVRDPSVRIMLIDMARNLARHFK